MQKPDLVYARMDGNPVICAPGETMEAYVFRDGAWRQVDYGRDVAMDATVFFSRAEFDRWFGPLPPLPAGAFAGVIAD